MLMNFVFEVIDKNGRRIHLSRERLKHIKRHPHMQEPIEILKTTLKNPTVIRYEEKDTSIVYFYKEFKVMNISEKWKAE